MALKQAEKLIGSMTQRNMFIDSLTREEKVEYIKAKYSLSHGAGKRKRKRKKH